MAKVKDARSATAADPASFRQSLLQLLETDPPHEEKLLKEFESRRVAGYPLYSSILYILTHLSFSEPEAARHWQKILAHRDRLRGELRREPGLRVAILDYFVNVNRELKNPKVIEISIYEKTERSAMTDGLTGLYNRAYFTQALRQEIQRCKRHELRMALVLLDLDDFKRLNDSRGHVEGDRVLVKAAALIRETSREIDVPARYGGEEFAVVLPETSRTGAYVVAERVREKIAAHFRRGRGAAAITVSGGVACFPDDAQTVEGLVQKADAALYRSKAAGKNQITLVRGERRRHPRVTATHPVTLGARGRSRTARAKNVSEGGLLVRLKHPVAVGSAVSIVIRAEEAPSVGLRGEVVRVDRVPGDRRPAYEVGVRFLGGAQKSKPPIVLRRVKTPARA
jgi:diguanylate cyclase (GGDEF)-like protein